MNHLFSLLNKSLFSKTSLSKDLTDTIENHHRVVIQKRLEAIAKDYEAQGVMAQLNYLQGIDLSSSLNSNQPKEF